jgi:hypothetical protein
MPIRQKNNPGPAAAVAFPGRTTTTLIFEAKSDANPRLANVRYKITSHADIQFAGGIPELRNEPVFINGSTLRKRVTFVATAGSSPSGLIDVDAEVTEVGGGSSFTVPLTVPIHSALPAGAKSALQAVAPVAPPAAANPLDDGVASDLLATRDMLATLLRVTDRMIEAQQRDEREAEL